MTTIYFAIGAVFVLNLIITLAVKVSIKRDRTIKNVNKHINDFRSEVSTTIERVNASAKDCQQNIDSRVEEANAVISKVAETLDIIFVHQRELSALDDVCKNYKIALEKLKLQTEQAEARIHAVHAEVRKAESINTYVLQFQKDSENLMNQLQDMKAEYVRLVASTEQSLKAAGQNQMEENDQMLSSFAVSLERFKGQFSEYIANEQAGFTELCRQQEIAASNGLNMISNENLKIQESIETSVAKLNDMRAGLESSIQDSADSAIEKLEQFKGELRVTVSELENRKIGVIETLNAVKERTISEMDAHSDEKASELVEMLSCKEQDMRASFDSYSQNLADERQKIENAVDGYSERLAQEERSIAAAIDGYSSRLADERTNIDLAIDGYSKRLEKEMGDINSAINGYSARLAEEMDNIGKAIDGYSKRLSEEKENIGFAIDGYSERLAREEEAISATIDGYSQRLSDEEKNIAMTIDMFSQRISMEENAVDEKITYLAERRDSVINAFESALDEKNRAFDISISSLENERERYVSRCREALEVNFNDVIVSSQDHLDRIRKMGDDFNKLLTERIREYKETIALLNEGSRSKISDAIENLAALEKRIRDAQDSLYQYGEEITSKKVELWDLKKGKEDVEKDLERLADEVQATKSARINEEAQLVRLKLKKSSLKKDEDTESASGEKKTHKKPSDMIEEFPDDIFIGDEENISLDDD